MLNFTESMETARRRIETPRTESTIAAAVKNAKRKDLSSYKRLEEANKVHPSTMRMYSQMMNEANEINSRLVHRKNELKWPEKDMRQELEAARVKLSNSAEKIKAQKIDALTKVIEKNVRLERERNQRDQRENHYRREELRLEFGAMDDSEIIKLIKSMDDDIHVDADRLSLLLLANEGPEDFKKKVKAMIKNLPHKGSMSAETKQALMELEIFRNAAAGVIPVMNQDFQSISTIQGIDLLTNEISYLERPAAVDMSVFGERGTPVDGYNPAAADILDE